MSERPVAQIRRACCDYRTGGPVGNPRRARWELYVVAHNGAWPSHKWPISSRHTIPTVQERTDALGRLGYQPAPDAEWEWQETETPGYHGHPSRVSMLGTIRIVPAANGGQS